MPRLCHAFLSLALSALMAACSHVPLSSLPQLARIDLSTTDLFAFRAAIRFPDAYVAKGTRMVVDLTIGDAPPRQIAFDLERVDSATERAPLENERRPGAQLVAYRLPDTAIAEFEAIRRGVTEARAQKKKGALTIKLEPDFCFVAAPPKGTLHFSTFLRTSETGSYVAVLRDFDALAQPGYAEQIRRMPKC